MGGVRWTADGKHLVYVDAHGGAENLWIAPVDGGPARPLTTFRDERWIEGIANGPESSFYIVRASYSNDVVRISDF